MKLYACGYVCVCHAVYVAQFLCKQAKRHLCTHTRILICSRVCVHQEEKHAEQLESALHAAELRDTQLIAVKSQMSEMSEKHGALAMVSIGHPGIGASPGDNISHHTNFFPGARRQS